MSSKHPKPGGNQPHPEPHKAGAQHNKCDVTGSIQIRGAVEATIPADLVKKRDAAEEEKEARDKFRLKVEIAGLIFVIIYAFLAGVGDWITYTVATTSQRQLEMDQRPWVGLMGAAHVNVTYSASSPITTSIEIQNTGKTPALNEVAVGKFETQPPSFPMPRFETYTQKDAGPAVTLMPNAIANIGGTTEKPSDKGLTINKLSETEVTAIDKGQLQLFLYGSIWYDDIFKKPHHTDYCLQFIPGPTHSFLACPVHNYAD